jgi:hypothetical protein
MIGYIIAITLAKAYTGEPHSSLPEQDVSSEVSHR